jgi:hypothetical protein
MAEVQFPSNSHKDREAAEERQEKREVKQIVQAKRKKTGLGQKLKRAFIGDESDTDSVIDYILCDILVPAAKNMLFDAVQGGVSMMLFGEDDRRRRPTQPSRNTYTNYSSYSATRNSRYDRDRTLETHSTPSRRSPREKIYNDDLIFDTRTDAYEVVDNLNDAIDDYGEVSLAELYVLVGIDSDPTDSTYGWRDLTGYSVKPCRDGFRLLLPPAYSLDERPRKR